MGGRDGREKVREKSGQDSRAACLYCHVAPAGCCRCRCALGHDGARVEGRQGEGASPRRILMLMLMLVTRQVLTGGQLHHR